MLSLSLSTLSKGTSIEWNKSRRLDSGPQVIRIMQGSLGSFSEMDICLSKGLPVDIGIICIIEPLSVRLSWACIHRNLQVLLVLGNRPHL